MAHVAAHDDIRSSGSSQRQILIILWIAALPDGLRWFDAFCGNDDNVDNAPATFDADEAIKLRAEDDLTIFVLDRLREKQSIRQTHGTEQRLFGTAIGFKDCRDKGRGVKDNDQALSSVRQTASSASMSSSVKPLARASCLASAMASARTSGTRPPVSNQLR